MELIVIDDSRLKIILSREEMQSYGLDSADVDVECPVAQRTLCDILERAKHTAGFIGECSRVFVQYFASRDGGCEMFVTRFSELCDEEECLIDISQKQKTEPRLRRRYVFRLATVRDLLALCRALLKNGYLGESEAYVSHQLEEIYLVLYEGAGADVSTALEFSEPLSFCSMSAYISEHCLSICDRAAVSTLGVL